MRHDDDRYSGDRPHGYISSPSAPSAPDPVPPTREGEWAVEPLLWRLHFYVGVLVGPFLIVAALTGLAYTITPQLDHLAYGDQLRVSEVGTGTVPLADQVARAEAVVPDGEVITVIPPASEDDATTKVVFAVPGPGGQAAYGVRRSVHRTDNRGAHHLVGIHPVDHLAG